MAEIADRLTAIDRHLLQVNGNHKLPSLTLFPRPEMAAERLADRKVRARHDSLHARLYGET